MTLFSLFIITCSLKIFMIMSYGLCYYFVDVAMHHFDLVDASIEKMVCILNVLFSQYEETCEGFF